MLRSATTAFVLALSLSAVAAEARAWDRDVSRELHLDVQTHLAVGYAVRFGDEDEALAEPYLRMGRLRTRLTLDGAGWTMFQVDVAGGEPRVLDAVAALTPSHDLTIRFGRFKVPISADFLIPLPNHPLTSRPLLVRHAPRRRLGADANARFRMGPARLDLNLGLFAENQTVHTDHGKLLAARAALTWGHAFGVHVGYGQIVFSDNEVNPATGGRPEPYDHVLDLALTYEDEHILSHVEALMVFDGPNHARCWGATTMAGYTFGDREGPLAVQPVLSYDLWRGALETEHRMGGGLNLQLAASRVILRLDYEAVLREERLGHATMFEVQVSF